MTEWGEICPKCNRVHLKCKAHNSQGLPCGRAPMNDQAVCGTHGGRAPAAMARAEAIGIRRRAAAMLTGYGIEIGDVDPLSALQTEVARAATAVAFYGMLVAELRVPDVAAPSSPWDEVYGIDDEGQPITSGMVAGLYGRDHKGDGAPHVLIKLWNEERDRLARYCKMALDAGIDERAIALAEGQAQQLVAIIVAVIDSDELSLSPEQRDVGRRVAAGHLRALGAGEIA